MLLDCFLFSTAIAFMVLPGAPETRYAMRAVLLFRVLAALCWLSLLLTGGFAFSFLVWTFFPSRFLRRHAFASGMLGLAWLAFLISGSVFNLTFIIESDNSMSSIEQFAGNIFSQSAAFPVLLIIFQSLFFLQVLGKAHSGASARLLFLAAVPFFYYNKALWAPVAGGGSFFEFDLMAFRNPYALLPGHFFLLSALFGAILSIGGKLPPLFLRRFYARLLYENRKKDELRRQAALWRSWVPGWGSYFAGEKLAAVTAHLAFLLVLLFATISLTLNYGELVSETKGLNANSAWYFLSSLGLKTATSDAELKGILGNGKALGILLALLALLIGWSRWRTQRLFQKATGRLPGLVPFSFLLHAIPLAMALLIPVSFVSFNRPAQAPARDRDDLVQVIPRFFEESKEMELDGSKPSASPDGNDEEPGKKKKQEIQNGPESTAPEEGTLQEGQGKGKGFKGKRAAMTYSNYLSAKIRGAEIWLSYWNQVPRPYSAVFEYRITESGIIENTGIVEPSSAQNADLLTLRLIEAMGVVLPPPEGQAVLVTELFWNTTPGDDSLPTEMQRNLSRAFDGRVIQRD